MNQDMDKVLINPPTPFFVSLIQRASRDLVMDTRAIHFVLHAKQAGSSITKTFPIGPLSKKTGKDSDRDK